MVLRPGSGRDDKMLTYAAGDLPKKHVYDKVLNTWNNLPLHLRSVNSLVVEKHFNDMLVVENISIIDSILIQTKTKNFLFPYSL